MSGGWVTVAASVQGSAHEESRMSCQDVHSLSTLAGGVGSPLIVVCADGAGSTEYGGLGASLVCQSVSEQLATIVDGGPLERVDRDVWLDILTCAQTQITEAAEKASAPEVEFASTMMAGIIGENGASFAQIGDGAIVIERDGAPSLVTWPQHGEYANMTSFVTSEDAHALLEHVAFQGQVGAFATFTDGLERLVLDFKHRQVPGGFLGPLWKSLRASTDIAGFQDELVGLLRSDRVRGRGDDDLTLILGVRTPKTD